MKFRSGLKSELLQIDVSLRNLSYDLDQAESWSLFCNLKFKYYICIIFKELVWINYC